MSEETSNYKISHDEPLASFYQAGDRLQAARAIILAACQYSDDYETPYAHDLYHKLLDMGLSELKASESDYHRFHKEARVKQFSHSNELFCETESAFVELDTLRLLLEGAPMNAQKAAGATGLLLTHIDIALEKYHTHLLDMTQAKNQVREEGRSTRPTH